MEKFLFLFVIALCGTLASAFNLEAASRIVNGANATTQRQYMVSLQQISQIELYTRGHRCGGVLVTLQHAVTAASCNFDNVNGTFVAINPAEYRVFSGQEVLTADISTYNYRRITTISVHPQYFTSTPYVNDIAVITLTQAFSYYINSPVQLPIRDAGTGELAPCNVAGWGAQNETADASVQLQQINKRIVLPGFCQTHYVDQFRIVDTMMCAIANGNTDFAGCTGDIGNPLVCRGYLNGIQIVNKNCTVSTIPEVYTRVSSYNEWIRTITGIPAPAIPDGASSFQPGMAILAVIAIAQVVIANVSY